MAERLTSEAFAAKVREILADAPADGSHWHHHAGGLYRVLCTTVMESTMEPLVHYESVAFGYRCTRTLADWRSDVPGRGPRFRPADGEGSSDG